MVLGYAGSRGCLRCSRGGTRRPAGLVWHWKLRGLRAGVDESSRVEPSRDRSPRQHHSSETLVGEDRSICHRGVSGALSSAGFLVIRGLAWKFMPLRHIVLAPFRRATPDPEEADWPSDFG